MLRHGVFYSRFSGQEIPFYRVVYPFLRENRPRKQVLGGLQGEENLSELFEHFVGGQPGDGMAVFGQHFVERVEYECPLSD